jgi:hypothetical protein
VSIIGQIIRDKTGAERSAALAEWVQGLYPADVAQAVLVGGGAVELFTEGAYTTGDLDFVGSVPKMVRQRLRESGFVRKGRHWIHEEQEVFLEFPSSELDEGESSQELEVLGSTVRVIGLEELIVDRLAAWQFWSSTIDGYNAWLLLDRRGSDVDPTRLEKLARRRDAMAALRSLLSFVAEHAALVPSDREIEIWAEEIPH